MDASVTDWIQAASAVFQAASAVAVVLMTAALVWVTRQYANSTKQMADVMAQDFETRNKPLMDLVIGRGRRSSTEGFELHVVVSNFGFQLVTLHSLEFDWWLLGRTEVHTKKIPIPTTMATFPSGTRERDFKIALLVQEVWQGRGNDPDLRVLRQLLYGKARIEFYSGQGIQEGTVPTETHRRETPAFQIQKP